MRQLSGVPNIDAADASYPAGRIRNDDQPTTDGTPVIEELYGDIIQVFHKLMRLAGIAYNDLPENETTGFQIVQALQYLIRATSASLTEKGSIEVATTAETQGLSDSLRATTAAGIAALIASVAEHNALTAVNRLCVPGRLPQASTTQSGLSKRASTSAIDSGYDNEPIANGKPFHVSPSELQRVLKYTAWTEITYGVGRSAGNIYYSKNYKGIVDIRVSGIRSSVALSDGDSTILGTIPAGYRPVSTHYLVVNSIKIGNLIKIVVIGFETGGNIVLYGGPDGVSISGSSELISFNHTYRIS